ncbi:phenylalanine--tRNA ligase subunit beta [Candidatus Desantisbacteria bacterium]|nr:phenylalanine--tRNA ligase subunit beta [Candidatus Desantisbacteria bacterium]
MKVSYNWLKENVAINIPPHELSDKLTMAGLEVAGIEEKDEDYIIDIELTVNRGDCLSIMGMAREVSAIMNIAFEPPEILQLKGENLSKIDISLQNPELCPRYTARVIQGIRVEPSPLWLQNKLNGFGIRPINNIVDVTNFCLAELGHPMHAFDYNLINGKNIIIRQALEDEKILALDEKEYELSQEMLLITDKMSPLALAGIIGGNATRVNDNTTTILMECACFSPSSVRKTARLLGIQTESSYRFERGVDPQGLIRAQDRAAGLILSMCPGAKVSGIIDCYPTTIPSIDILLRIERVNRILGTEVTPEEMRDILIRLGFEVEPIVFHAYTLAVKVPSFRKDITREIDIVEEIVRIHGYEKVPVSLPSLTSVAFKKKAQIVNEKAKDILCGCGLNEVITYSFLNPEMLDKVGQAFLPVNNPVNNQAFLPVNHVVVSNPLSEEGRLLTHSLIPNLLEVVARNINQGNGQVKIFEIAKVFFKSCDNDLPVEQEHLVIMIRDDGDKVRWDGEKQKGLSFYDLSGILHALFAELGICEYTLEETEDKKFHPYVCAAIMVKDEKLGSIGQINPDITENLKLPQNIYALEIEWQKIMTLADFTRKFTPLPRYPSVIRDIAILAENEMPSSKIVEIIREAGNSLIEDIRLFDLYHGEQVSEGYKSLAYSITYRSPDKTLTENEVGMVHEGIIQLLMERLGVRVR